MTEDEAKTKWCPMARIRLGEAAINRTFLPNPDCNCLASGCAAWRWGDIVQVKVDDPRGLPASDPRTVLDAAIIGTKHRFLPRPGYCGLAGKP